MLNSKSQVIYLVKKNLKVLRNPMSNKMIAVLYIFWYMSSNV